MNILKLDKQTQIISALTEGCSIRATERLTGCHRDTHHATWRPRRHGLARLHDRTMLGLRVSRIEIDEIWSFDRGIFCSPVGTNVRRFS